MQSPSKLRVASKHRLHGGMDGDDGNDWLQAKDPVRPDDQLELTEEELKVELTRILRADNPHAPDNIVRFSHKEGAYRQMSSVEQCAFHFSMPAVMVHVDSEEARRMAVRRRFSKQPPATTTAEAGTGGTDEGEASGTAEAGTSTGEDAPDEGVGGDGEGGVGEPTEGGEGEEAAPEAEADAEADEEDGDDDDEINKPLRNQFNFSERASQTYNYAMRERGTMTEAPARAAFGATATQWAMYDAYSADLERQAAAKEKSTKKKLVKEEKRNTAANPLSRDPNDEAASGWTAAAKIVDLSVARKIERMCNQNTFDDVAQDFKYWDDPSDSFKEGEASLLPLWKLTYEKARKRTVTCMAWCPGYWDLLFVGFGSYDYTKQGAGVIAAYSLKNPSFPEYTVETDNGVMCIDVHPEQPSLLAVGFYNGEVAVYDLR
jgi:dynein intermediate chain 1